MTDKELFKQALDALETECDIYREHDEDGAPEYILETIAALKERLAQPEQEPLAWRDVIVVNLVREGINKHRARELAEHFIKLTTPPAQPPQRTEQEPVVYVKPDLSTLNHSRDCRFHDNETYCTCYAESEHELEFWRSRAITYLPQRTEPIQSLQCFHCQVTIETLNDKVMHLMAERKPLTEEQIWKAIRPLATTDQLCKKLIDISMDEYRAIEVAHGIKEKT